MKYEEVNMTPECGEAIERLIMERLKNIAVVQKLPNSKVSETQCLIAELVMVECKLEALTRMFENGEKDFSEYNNHLVGAAENGTGIAIEVRKQMVAAAEQHQKNNVSPIIKG